MKRWLLRDDAATTVADAGARTHARTAIAAAVTAAILATFTSTGQTVQAAPDPAATGQTQAVNATELTTSPAITEWIISPGKTQTETIVLTNQTDKPQPVRSVAQKFTPNESFPKEMEAVYDASGWFTVKDPDFILQPHEARSVSVTLAAPTNATPGGHYATLYFQQLKPAPENGNRGQATIAGRVGSLAFITVTGNVTKKLEAVGSLHVQRQQDGYQFTTELRNIGNTHTLPTVRYIVTNWRKRQIAANRASLGLLLPHTSRTYSTEWQPPLIGRYTVTAEITYGNRQAVHVAAVTIWQVPWRIIAPALGVGSFGWLGVYRHRTRWRRAWRELRQG